MTARLDYAATCQKLHEQGWPDFDPAPPIPERMPRYDDPEPLGVQFFRELVSADLSGLTLPRTFVGRCEIREVSFCNTDLSESALCWNDFIDVDFIGAVLYSSDLRASSYERVSFAGADLRSVDFRRADFIGCVFDDASMMGARLTREQGQGMSLSKEQRLEIAWQDDDGEEPDGG
jgi:BTB/POZ domain-containing protein KCTD9